MPLPLYRLSIPRWMAAWPRSIRPRSLRVYPRGWSLDLGSGSRVWVSPPHAEAPGWRVRAADDRAGASDVDAVQAQLSRETEAAAWAQRVDRVLGALVRGAPSDPLVGLLRSADLADVSSWPAALAAAGRLDPAAQAGLALASGQTLAALALGERCAASLAARPDLAARTNAALLASVRGQPALSRRLARECVPDDDPHERILVSELLFACGCPDEGCAVLAPAAPEVPQVAYTLLQDAARARRPDVAEAALAHLSVESLQPGQAARVPEALVEAGAMDAAERWLATTLARQPEDAAARLWQARLALWRGEVAAARALAEQAAQAGAPEDGWREVLGAAAILAGDVATALAHLDALDARGVRSTAANLWHAEALLLAGRGPDALELLRREGYADQPLWHLLRGLVWTSIDRPPWDSALQGLWPLLIDQLGRDEFDRRFARGDEHAMVRQVLARTGGNRTPRATYAQEGRLRPADDLIAPRTRAERTQDALDEDNLETVLDEFETLQRRYPEVPFFTTYAAELLLWTGHYERAHERFERSWQETHTRWAYVGAGAALLFLGQPDEALRRWQQGEAHWGGLLPREATYAYRGELRRRRGELDRAHEDLTHAVRAVDSRLFAWLSLALVERARGREDEAQQSVAAAARLAPALLHEASGGDPAELLATATIERALGSLRGNASSRLYVFCARDGRLRVLSSEQGKLTHEAAARSFTRWRDALVETLVARSR